MGCSKEHEIKKLPRQYNRHLCLIKHMPHYNLINIKNPKILTMK